MSSVYTGVVLQVYSIRFAHADMQHHNMWFLIHSKIHPAKHDGTTKLARLIYTYSSCMDTLPTAYIHVLDPLCCLVAPRSTNYDLLSCNAVY